MTVGKFADLAADIPPRAEIETRSAAGQMEVRFPERVISLVAMPYDQPTAVVHHGRVITEVCRPGAFDGVERRANRIRVNRGHQLEAVCGRAVALHPSRSEGLVADLRMARTPLGDESLELAADGALGASVGFAPMPGGEQWTADRRTRELSRCWLGHIALTADEAYQGAEVLSVRHRGPELVAQVVVETPNLDQVRAWLLQARYDQLSP